jgi:hypothetical protein
MDRRMPDTTRECSVGRWKEVNADGDSMGRKRDPRNDFRWTSAGSGRVSRSIENERRNYKSRRWACRGTDGDEVLSSWRECRRGLGYNWHCDSWRVQSRCDVGGWANRSEPVDRVCWLVFRRGAAKQTERSGATRGNVPGGYWGNLGRCTPSSVRSREGGGGTYAVECDGPEALVRLTIDCWGWEDGMRMMVHVLGVGGRLTVRLAGGTGLRGPKPAPT